MRRIRSSLLSNLSVVTWLIALNVAVFIFLKIAINFSPIYLDYLGLQTNLFLQGKFLWTIFTHMFTHFYFWHLLINMFVLYSLGGLCEKIIGSKRFLWFYLISGLFAGILTVILTGLFGDSSWGARIFGENNVLMMGASGAIFAIAGLYTVLLPKLKFSIIFLPFFSLPAYVMIPLVLFGTWFITIVSNWPIGNVAHFGGFVVGILYGFYLKSKYKRKVVALQKVFR